ncbi:MAG: hypothetical protein LZF60_370022 [Nitrospira sp.]|nr:MAG: hypothetical protein LZF60_370022 [Nitrospira sp.]
MSLFVFTLLCLDFFLFGFFLTLDASLGRPPSGFVGRAGVAMRTPRPRHTHPRRSLSLSTMAKEAKLAKEPGQLSEDRVS